VPEVSQGIDLVHVMLQHGDVRSMNSAATRLIDERALLPTALRVALDSWLMKMVVPRAGHAFLGSKPDRTALDQLLAVAGEPERRKEALSRFQSATLDGAADYDRAAWVVAMNTPELRTSLVDRAATSPELGAMIASTVGMFPDALDVLADHASEQWAGYVFARIERAACDAGHRSQQIQHLETALGTGSRRERRKRLLPVQLERLQSNRCSVRGSSGRVRGDFDEWREQPDRDCLSVRTPVPTIDRWPLHRTAAFGTNPERKATRPVACQDARGCPLARAHLLIAAQTLRTTRNSRDGHIARGLVSADRPLDRGRRADRARCMEAKRCRCTQVCSRARDYGAAVVLVA
jgi:hypothetical protein